MILKAINKNKLPWWKWLITAGLEEKNPHVYSRTLFVNCILQVVALVLLFFVVFHINFSGEYWLALFDGIALMLVVFLYLSLHIKNSVKFVGHASAIVILTFYFFFIPMTQNLNMSFTWVFFAPLMIILINGWKVGLYYMVIFCAVIFPMAYMNIGEWDYGQWSELHFYRLIVGIFFATAIGVFVDVAQFLSNEREQRTHDKEARYLADLKVMSQTDGLTGLYNRHHFNQVFDEKVARLEESNHFLIFFIIDIDFFKAYNDTYGHQAGDEVIQKVSMALKEFMKRENDLVFRLGGEEFGGLIETREPKETAFWLGHLADHIRALKIPHSPSVDLPYITISGGVSAIDSNPLFTKKHLYKRADDALYRAKSSGRDRFVIDEKSIVSIH